MTYDEVLDYLYNNLPYYQRKGKVSYKANLDNTISLDNYFGNPHTKFKSIHIAGTNGKGSVSHMLASVLQVAGYKVGLYTSPHLKDFRERIRINGIEIPKKEVTEFVSENIVFFEKQKPSFFEITVAMAFYYFAKSNVDIAIIEVGLGGRLDSTNIIAPILSIITNISLDHTDLLGNTIQQIAVEKAGIIKEKVPLIVSESNALYNDIFIKIANDKSSYYCFADKLYSSNYSMITLDNNQIINIYKNGKLVYENLKVDLLGEYQRKNMNSVLLSIDLLNEVGINISPESIYKGLEQVCKNTGIKGRWQIIRNNPKIVADTAHNEEGLRQVIEQILNNSYKRLHIIIGFVSDKDVDEILKLFPNEALYYFTKAQIPRALDENILKSKALKLGLKGDVFSTVSVAFNEAKKNALKEDFIFIGGSTFIVAEVL